MSMMKRAILLFVASESIFFILLILAYLHFYIVHGPSGGSQLLDPARTGLYSVFLLVSSFTVWMGIRGMRQQSVPQLAFWLVITIGLGSAFLYGQGTEWWGLIQHRVTIDRDLFGTTFFTLTGFHGFHVFIGLIMLTVLLALTLSGAIIGGSEDAADTISIYWHFVDGVWIVVFSVIYLVPLL